MLNKLTILIVAYSLVGCVSTVPLQGMLKDSRDQFSGVVTINFDRTAIFAVTTVAGKKCSVNRRAIMTHLWP